MTEATSINHLQVSKDLYPKEAWQLISENNGNNDLIILDVSTPKAFRNLRIEGAININFFSRFFKARLNSMDKHRTYIVYCKLGGRSKIARKIMKKLGFSTVYNIIGGTMLWEEEALPFAAGSNGVSKFTFCPVYMTAVTLKKLKLLFHLFSPKIQPRGVDSTTGRTS